MAGGCTRVSETVYARPLRQFLVKNACRLVQDEYDWSVTMSSFLELVDWVADRVFAEGVEK